MNTSRPRPRSIATACTARRTMSTPLGPLLLARSCHGLIGAWFSGQRDHPGLLEAPEPAEDELLDAAEAALTAYFAGDEAPFTVPIELIGTDFQRAVWNRLLAIGRDRTTTYGAIAREIGRPTASRAVGAAVGQNPVSVIVPCHRVIGSDGTLTGYAGGLPRKVALLELEGHRSLAGSPEQAELLAALPG